MGRAFKFLVAVLGFVLDGLREDGRKGMYHIQEIVGDHHEDGEEGLLDCKQVVVGRLPFNGEEGVVHLLKKERDCIGCHGDNYFVVFGAGRVL